ncbi:hypothetical protein FRX31_022123 [Thalictrum thalictroides]|uniref:Uncharacterized protein n=1 Tax=Thalictrum thalictroides TaxID=46969 RepID=A0A7J6VT69_THATH|nr:hypothetical protein FRX31_022123 [Thalictrum thalictroides]
MTELCLALNICDPYVLGDGRKGLKQALKALKTKQSTFRKQPPERFYFLIEILTSLIMKLENGLFK